jgi:hypothetical protein
MTISRYLRRRRIHGFSAIACPKKLAACGISGELVRSLRTNDHHIARWRARLLSFRIACAMEQTVVTSKNQIETLVRGWIDGRVFAHEVRLAQTGGFDFLENDEITALGKEEARDLESLLRFAGSIHNDSQKKAVEQVLSGIAIPTSSSRSYSRPPAR